MAHEPDLIDRYLPAEFAARLPPVDRAWRGRTVLLLWALGYPLDMAWSLGMADDAEQSAFYRSAMTELDDDRLCERLEATAHAGGDGRELAFGWLGAIEVLVRRSTPRDTFHGRRDENDGSPRSEDVARWTDREPL